MNLRDLINPIANPEVGLLLFVGIFLVIIVWVLTRRRKDIQKQAQIPLHDEPVEPRIPPGENPDEAPDRTKQTGETKPTDKATNTQEDSA